MFTDDRESSPLFNFQSPPHYFDEAMEDFEYYRNTTMSHVGLGSPDLLWDNAMCEDPCAPAPTCKSDDASLLPEFSNVIPVPDSEDHQPPPSPRTFWFHPEPSSSTTPYHDAPAPPSKLDTSLFPEFNNAVTSSRCRGPARSATFDDRVFISCDSC